MLGSFRRRFLSFSQKFSRGYLTHRRAQKDEWWAVDGEIFKAEEFDPKRVLEPSPNTHMTNKKRRKDRMKQLMLTRLKLRTDNQEPYWTSYIRRYQIMRDEWEKIVWDPIPEPPLKTRNPSLVRKDAEKYVWRDPRRDAYNYQDPRLSRMDKPLSASHQHVDNKNASRYQNTDRYPFMAWRGTDYDDARGYYKSQPYRSRGPYKEEDDRSVHTHRSYRDEENGGTMKYQLRKRGWSEDDDDDEDDDDHDHDEDNRAGGIKQATINYREEKKRGNVKPSHRSRGWSEDEDDDDDDDDDEDRRTGGIKRATKNYRDEKERGNVKPPRRSRGRSEDEDESEDSDFED